MKIAMIGSGVYSIALSHALNNNKNNIKIWTHDGNFNIDYIKNSEIEEIRNLNNISLVSTNLEEVVENTEIIFIVTASKFFKNTISELKKYYNNQIICIATKGIDDEEKNFLSNIAQEVLHTEKISVLSGPSFATDIINNDVVALTLASQNKEALNLVSKSLESDTLIIEKTDDILGVQVCNTIKNIVAISSGMLFKMGYTNSTNAFLITKVMQDLKTLLKDLQLNENTAYSYAGVGDMLLTCTSKKSRNYSFGMQIVDIGIENINLKETTVEGYYALKSFYELLNNLNMDFKLVTILYGIIYNNENINNIKNYLK